VERAKIKIGRDALGKLLRQNNLLVPKTKRFHITTDSKHFFYKSPNLLKETEITHSEQVIVSDITYLKTDDGHAYLALATDPYLYYVQSTSIPRKLWDMLLRIICALIWSNKP
jgi:transposase InsO family protein